MVSEHTLFIKHKRLDENVLFLMGALLICLRSLYSVKVVLHLGDS